MTLRVRYMISEVYTKGFGSVKTVVDWLAAGPPKIVINDCVTNAKRYFLARGKSCRCYDQVVTKLGYSGRPVALVLGIADFKLIVNLSGFPWPWGGRSSPSFSIWISCNSYIILLLYYHIIIVIMIIIIMQIVKRIRNKCNLLSMFCAHMRN